MKQFLLIIMIFVFEGIALWGIGEKVGLRRHYDKLRNYPTAESTTALKVKGNMLADNVNGKCHDIVFHRNLSR